MRTSQGLSEVRLEERFGQNVCNLIVGQLRLMAEQQLVTRYGEGRWRLTDEGMVLSNQVFVGLTYLKGELPA